MTPGLEVGVGLVVALSLLGAGLFAAASLAGRWPLWLAGFAVTLIALVAAFLLAPETRAVPVRGDPAAVNAAPGSIAAAPDVRYNQRVAPAARGAPNHQPQGKR